MSEHTSEPDAIMECGCQVWANDAGILIRYCPTHAAAPDLLVACEEASEWLAEHVARPEALRVCRVLESAIRNAKKVVQP